MPTTDHDTEWKIRKAEACYWMAQRASERFESYRRLEWQIAFGLWAILGGGTAVVFNAEWPPTVCFAICSTLVVVCLFIPYVQWFDHLNKSMQRESRTSYFWETHVMEVYFPGSDVPLREGLRPSDKPDTLGPWPTAYNSEVAKISREPHKSHYGQMVVTALLAVMFLSLLWSRATHRDEEVKAKKPSVERQGATSISRTACRCQRDWQLL